MEQLSREEGVVLIATREDLAQALLHIAPYMSGYTLDEVEVNPNEPLQYARFYYVKKLPLL